MSHGALQCVELDFDAVVDLGFDEIKRLVSAVTFANKVLADGEVPSLQ